ncbi:MAG TPA: YlxR family protein [Solirubrobacteraceae bacterium]|nr:YlxR family protein [Solirubrobacteraceae bacterium]
MPRRRCVGCGRIAPKSELLRLAAVPEAGRRTRRAVIDPTCALPGRGAYLCRAPGLQARPKSDCLELAERQRGIARTLRCAVTLGPEFVESGKP